MTAADRAMAMAEVNKFPRGDRWQNLYRAVLQQALFNGLASRPEIAATAPAAHALALSVVRRYDPDFVARLGERR